MAFVTPTVSYPQDESLLNYQERLCWVHPTVTEYVIGNVAMVIASGDKIIVRVDNFRTFSTGSDFENSTGPEFLFYQFASGDSHIPVQHDWAIFPGLTKPEQTAIQFPNQFIPFTDLAPSLQPLFIAIPQDSQIQSWIKHVLKGSKYKITYESLVQYASVIRPKTIPLWVLLEELTDRYLESRMSVETGSSVGNMIPKFYFRKPKSGKKELKVEKAPEHPTVLLLKAIKTKIELEISARQLEQILFDWWRSGSGIMRTLTMWGVRGSEVWIYQNRVRPWFSGDGNVRQISEKEEKCSCGSASLQDNWCGFCSPALISSNPSFLQKHSSLRALLRFPFAFHRVSSEIRKTLFQRSRLFETAIPKDDEICGNVLTLLFDNIESNQHMCLLLPRENPLTQKLEKIKNLLAQRYGVISFERGSCNSASRVDEVAPADRTINHPTSWSREAAPANHPICWSDEVAPADRTINHPTGWSHEVAPTRGVTSHPSSWYIFETYHVENVCANWIASTITSLEQPTFALSISSKPAIPVKQTSLSLTPIQQQAVDLILAESTRSAIITGGPGTGKTSILREVVATLEAQNFRGYRLSAFTGKAVSRIKQQTKCHPKLASTLHRLIAKNDTNFRLLIIDEASMLTPELFASFLGKWNPAELAQLKIIFVGDIDQLPPIGYGNLFKILLEIPQIPKIKLTDNFRTSSDQLLQIFEKVRNAVADVTSFSSKTGDQTINFYSGETVTSVVKKVVAGIGADSKESLGILAVYSAEVNRLNELLKTILVTDRSQEHQNYCVGDQIMITKNVYGVSATAGAASKTAATDEQESGFDYVNGDCGVITSINEDGFTVELACGNPPTAFVKWHDADEEFETRETDFKPPSARGDVSFGRDDVGGGGTGVHGLTNKIVKHAFAITVHKSQGSEYDHVVLVLPRTTSSETGREFVTRSLIYTAITRAKKSLTVVSEGNVGRVWSKCIGTETPPRAGNLLWKVCPELGRGDEEL